MYWFLADIAGTFTGTVLLGLFLIPPGVLIACATDALGFRRQTPLRQALIAVALGIPATPLLTYLAARVGGFSGVYTAHATVWIVLAVLAVRHRSDAGRWLTGIRTDPLTPTILLAAGVWLCIALFILPDMPFGDGILFPGGPYYDVVVHTGVVDAVQRAGIPPPSQWYHPGHAVPLVYHYFWYAAAGMASRFADAIVSSRTLVYAGSVWAMWALLGLAVLATSLLPDRGPERNLWRNRAVVGLAFVGGLDALIVLPNDLIYALTGHGFYWDHVEMWNATGTVSSWINTSLWSPHNVAAFIACMTGFLLLRDDRRVSWALAGMTFAASSGLSIWTTFTAAGVAVVWFVLSAFRRDTREIRALTVAGVVSVALALPFLLELCKGSGGFPVAFDVRDFYPALRALEKLGVPHGPIYEVFDVLALPFEYAVEFGFVIFGGIAWWLLRKRAGEPLERDERFLLTTVFTALTVSTLLQSDIHNNDLGWHGMMYVSLPLQIWSADALPEILSGAGTRKPVRAMLVAMLVAGVLTGGYQVVKLRFHEPVFDRAQGWPFGRRTASMRATYEWIDANLPPDAIVQHDPLGAARMTQYASLYSGRAMAYDEKYARELSGGPDSTRIALDMRTLWSPATSADSAHAITRRYGIDALVVTVDDSLWWDSRSWVWNAPNYYRSTSALIVDMHR